jgi:hypothetical protein
MPDSCVMFASSHQPRGEPAGIAPYGDFGTARHPALPARFARALAGGAPSREGLARPSARARAQRAGVVGKVQVPKSPQGEARGMGWQVGCRRAERTLSGFPCQRSPAREGQQATPVDGRSA